MICGHGAGDDGWVGRRALVLLIALTGSHLTFAEVKAPRRPASAPEAATTTVSADALPGWGTEQASTPFAVPVDDGAPLPLSGIGAGMATRTRIEAGLAIGPGAPLAEIQLRGLVRSLGGVVFGAAIPIIISPALDGSPVDTGNVVVEAHWSLASPKASTSRFWIGSLRFLFPAGTRNPFFMMIPGRDRNSAGVEAAAVYRRRLQRWAVHVETGGGLYIDDLMAFRLGMSGTASYRLLPGLEAFAQADPWLVWIPRPVTDPGSSPRATPQLAASLGMKVTLGRVGIQLAYQRVVPHTRDHHLWMVIDLLLDAPTPPVSSSQ